MPKLWSKIRVLVGAVLIKISDILVPEDERIARLLSIPFAELRTLLPNSRVRLEDKHVLFDYQNKTVRSLIHYLKFKNNFNVINFFAKCLQDDLLEMVSDIQSFDGRAPLITTVPMSKKELRERGFNHTESLLQKLKSLSDSTLQIRFDLLKKVRDTNRQTKLGREARAKNLYKCMEVFPSASSLVEGRTIILIDDVFTTGATFDETSRALSAACPKKVIGVFLAH